MNQQTNTGKTALYYACQNRNYLATCALLKAGANVNIPDERKVTPLYFSCLRGSLWIINNLINYGADIEKETSEGYTPLMFACQLGKYKIINFLLIKGANVNHTTRNGYNSPINILADLGNDSILQLIITEYKAKVNVKEESFSPLYFATKKDNFSTMKLLIDNGAKLDKKTLNLIKERIKNGTSKDPKFLQNFLEEVEVIEFVSDIDWSDDYKLNGYCNDIFGKDELLLQDNSGSPVADFDIAFESEIKNPKRKSDESIESEDTPSKKRCK